MTVRGVDVAMLLLALRGAVAVVLVATLVGGMPRIVQLGLGVVVGVWAAGVAADPAALAPAGAALDAASLVVIGAREVVLGATIGVVAVVPLLAAAMGGRLVDLAGGTRGPYAGFVSLLAAAVFVGIDGHVTLVAAIAASHRDVPALATVQPEVLTALGALVGAAVRLALPWLVTAAIVELAVGVGARLAGRSVLALPSAVAVPAALVMMSAALVATLAVAIAALLRGTL